MFERTALPDGPRVISARLPGTRALHDRSRSVEYHYAKDLPGDA